MRLPSNIPVFGDVAFRGKCPVESIEQVTFFNKLRREYPETWGVLALHPRNEGLKTDGQIRAVSQYKAEGMTIGASDIIIPGRIAFVCELKRADHTQCAWQEGQIEYLKAAQRAGAFACIGLGWLGAWKGFETWLKSQA